MKAAVRLLGFVSLITLVACNGGGSGSGGSSVRARLIDAPVQGVEYINTDGEKDITEIDGGFYCKSGSKVQFFVGKIKLGNPISCVANSLVYPQDLVGDIRGNFDTTSQSVKVVAFLLSAAAKTPETWNFGNPVWEAQCEAERQLWIANPNVGGSNDCNPPQLMVTQTVRNTMTVSSFTKVPENDAQLLDLINEVREAALGHGWDIDAVQLQAILENSKKHLELSLLEYSGIINDDTVTEPTNNLIPLASLSDMRTQIESSSEVTVSSGYNSITAKCSTFGDSTVGTSAFSSNNTEYVNNNHSIEMCVATETKTLQHVGGAELVVSTGDMFIKEQIQEFDNNLHIGNGSLSETRSINYRSKMIISDVVLDFEELEASLPNYSYAIPEIKGAFFKLNNEIRWYKVANVSDVTQFGYDYGDIHSTGSNVVSLYYFYINANGDFTNQAVDGYGNFVNPPQP